MFAARILDAVDVFEEGDFDLTASLPVATPDQFGLERLEEAFDRCPAGDLQSKSAERGQNCRNNYPSHSWTPETRACAEASDSRGRNIAIPLPGNGLLANRERGDPCDERSLVAAFGSPLSRMAMFSARKARSCFMRLLMAQPTTRREKRSMITAR